MSVQSVLFDAPGPKARNTYRIMAVIGAIAILALLFLIVRGLANPANNQLTAAKWTPLFTADAWRYYFLPGIWKTVQAAALAVVISAVFGALLGMGRLSEVKVLRLVCGVFVEFFRSVPVLMMMLFFYYVGLFSLQLTGNALPLFGVVAGLVFYNSSVIAELIRSGVHSLPKGQREAGLAVGMSPNQVMITILLPQAITAMLPSLVSQLVVILKDTALGYIITYPELIRAGQNFANGAGNLIPTLILVAAIFILINYGLTRLARLLERRLQKSAKGGKTPPAGPLTDPAMTTSASADADVQRQAAS